MNKKFVILTLVIILLSIGVILLKQSSESTTFIWNLSNGGKWLLPLVIISALIDSINPCAFSILLLTIAFLFSIGRKHTDIFKIGSAYIFGIFLIYILIGLGVLQTLHLFNTPHFMAKVGATLIIVLGSINLINEWWPQFPIKLKIPSVAHHKMSELIDKSSIPAALVLGGLVGICEFPCTGGPYLMILGLLHDFSTYWKGLGYLLFYNLIFILPLIIILLLASDKVMVEKIRQWQKQERYPMKIIGGILMILLGIIIFLF